MTAVIAVIAAGGGAMAADSSWSGAYLTRSNPKIRRIGSALVASAGAMAHLFLDQEEAEFPSAEPSVFAARWREWCVERGHFRLNDEHGCRQYPACFLILAPDGLYEIDDDGEACKHPPETRCAAIGIGSEVCMGAAHALAHLSPAVVAARAIEAAISLCEGCRGPLQVCVLEAAHSHPCAPG